MPNFTDFITISTAIYEYSIILKEIVVSLASIATSTVDHNRIGRTICFCSEVLQQPWTEENSLPQVLMLKPRGLCSNTDDSRKKKITLQQAACGI